MIHLIRRISRKQKLVILLVSLFLLSGGATFAWFNRTQTASVSLEPALTPPPQPTIAPENLGNATETGILLMGYGGAGHQGGYLTDAMMLAYLNFEKKILGLISIPRDLWVSLPNGNESKINRAFSLSLNSEEEYPTEAVQAEEAESGGDFSQAMVAQVTGLPVNYSIAVDFTGLEQAINELGGLTVEVPVAFEDPWYPVRGRELLPCGFSPEEIAEMTAQYSGFELEKQFPCRYETLSFPQGSVEMDGETALKFVRSRHGSHGGDFARSERQQALLLGVRDRLLSLDALSEVGAFHERLSGAVYTDMSLEAATGIVAKMPNITDYQVVKVSLNDSNVLKSSTSSRGAYILMPKAGMDEWGGVQAFVREELGI